MLPLQDGTKWSDGTDLTADDVVFTFELGKTASVELLDRVELPRLGRRPSTRGPSSSS